MKNKVILPLIMVSMLSGVGSAMMTVASGVNPARIGSFMAARPLPFIFDIMTNAFGITRSTDRLWPDFRWSRRPS